MSFLHKLLGRLKQSYLVSWLISTSLFLLFSNGALAVTAPHLETTQPHQREILISLSLDEIEFSTVIEDGETYQQIIIPGFGLSGEVGRPELPFKGLFFEIPYGVTAKAEVIKQDREFVAAEYRVYPRQPPQVISGPRLPFFIDEDFYRTSVFTPSNLLYQVAIK